MEEHDEQPPAPKSLRDHFRKGLRESAGRRPVSFYLLVAILVMVLLGAPYFAGSESPGKFAFFLILNFIFFFVVTARAIIDFIEISKKHFSESHKLYADTLGEKEFVEKLGKNVSKHRDE